MVDERETRQVEIKLLCRWCDHEFVTKVDRPLLRKIGVGEPCVICPNCKQET